MESPKGQRRESARASAPPIRGWEQVRGFRLAHLATTDAKGKPLVVPLCFACSANCIYSVVDEKPKRLPAARLRRLRNIQANPQVCFLVDHYEEDWNQLAYILVEGTAALLTGGAEHSAAIGLLREKYPQYRAMALEDKPVIKISPQRVTLWQAR